MSERDLKRIRLIRSLLRQIIREDAKKHYGKCHKLSKKLDEVAMKIEAKYFHLDFPRSAGATKNNPLPTYNMETGEIDFFPKKHCMPWPNKYEAKISTD